MAMDRAFEFGITTIPAVARHMEKMEGFQAAILSRSLFEVAAMVLWAILMPNGWMRWLGKAREEDQKTFLELTKAGGFPWAKEKLGECEAAATVVGPSCGGMKSVLQDIAEADKRAGSSDRVSNRSLLEYPVFYRTLSRAVHMNPATLAMVPAQAFASLVPRTCLYASFNLGRAVRHLFEQDITDLIDRFILLLIGESGVQAYQKLKTKKT